MYKMRDIKSYFQISINSRSHLSQPFDLPWQILFADPSKDHISFASKRVRGNKGQVYFYVRERDTFDYILERF